MNERQKKAWVELQTRISKLSKDSIVIDCGANVGNITQLFADSTAQVYAFEPDPKVFSILKKKFAHMPNFTLINKAVGMKDAYALLYRSPYYAENFIEESEKNTILHNALTRRRGGGWQRMDTANTIEVPVINFIEFVEGILVGNGTISILKLDVEGMEVPILEELERKNLFGKIEFTIAELHPRRFPRDVRRIERLRELISRKYTPNRVNLDWL